jgi:hypothetical protein
LSAAIIDLNPSHQEILARKSKTRAQDCCSRDPTIGPGYSVAAFRVTIMIRWRRERRSVHEDHHGDRHRQILQSGVVLQLIGFFLNFCG